MSTAKKQQACILIKIERPSGCDTPWLLASLGERTSSDEDCTEYPRTPETVNGIFCGQGGSFCLMTITHRMSYGGCVPFGDVEFRSAAFVDAYKCKQMLAALSKIGRRMSAISKEFGHPQTWQENVGRFASATGAKSIAISNKTLAEYLPTVAPPDTRGWSFFDLATGRHVLGLLRAKLVETLGGEEPGEATGT